jgi:hypothetical protein
MSGSAYPFENARFQWEEGWRRYQELSDDPALRRQAERVVEAIREGLRRRVGSSFTAAELAEDYGRGTDWCQRVAEEVAPSMSSEAQKLGDAAYRIYLRSATDFAGGRRG